MYSSWLEFWSDPNAIWIALFYFVIALLPIGLSMGGSGGSTNYMNDDNQDE